MKCEFVVEFPGSIDKGDAIEWIEFCIGKRGGISILNPLDGYELTSDNIDLHDASVYELLR